MRIIRNEPKGSLEYFYTCILLSGTQSGQTEVTFKIFVKNPNLIGMSSKLLCNTNMCICIRKNYKNGKFSPFHFW